VRRTIAKALTYRTLGSGTTLLVGYAVTGSLPEAGAMTALLLVAKVAGYVVHERVWEHTP